jgi:phosphate transport system substrate-binding protein
VRPRPLQAAVAVIAVSALAALAAAPASAAASHSPIAGSGSSWSSNAVNQWVADVQPNGLQVVFTASGSAIGRKDFANKTTDFAVSDIGFQGTDKVTGDDDTSQGRDFSYLPIVAGGTAFPYQLKVAGKLVRNLRLSGSTLAKIFTNQITNWNDPAITRDNNGKALPSKPVIPVVHSEGSGSSAQFTRYLDSVQAGSWRPFFGGGGFTEYFPRKGSAIAQNGSDGVMNYVASDAADGAIGYDEYSYALGKNFPVAKIENSNGFYTLPSQYNVAVSLTSAQINTDKSSKDYLLQNLDKVYTQKDNRTYPLSSYSYMVIPTSSSDSRMTTAKRQTLADYLYYSVCEGQKEMGPIGFSPLPVNLAQASLDQVGKLKAADSNVDLTKRDIANCGNPTFIAGQPNRNYLAEIAPQPQSCDKDGVGPCTTTTTFNANPTKGKPVGTTTTASGTTTSTGGSTPTTPTGTGAQPVAGAAVPGRATGPSLPGSAALVPATVQETTAPGPVDLVAVPTEVASSRRPISGGVLGALTVLLLLITVCMPPLLARRMKDSP